MRINQYSYQILDYLENLSLSAVKDGALIESFLNYCLPFLKEAFKKELLNEIPDHHKKAMIACYLGAYMVYSKGLDWSPSIIDILPLTLQEITDKNKFLK